MKKCKNECRQRSARSKCHQNIHKFAKSLFDTSDDSDISPQFGKSDAECFFREVYSSGPRNFIHPEWLPTPAPPQYEFNCEAISIQEVTEAIRHTRSTSTPSPLDQISYTIFKKCPSLHNALVDIYNLCWEKSDVPPAWKTAVIKLLPKIQPLSCHPRSNLSIQLPPHCFDILRGQSLYNHFAAAMAKVHAQ